METVSEKRLIDLACSDMDTRPDLWEGESMACEILELRAANRTSEATMTWQDEPSGEGWYWVENEAREPFRLFKNVFGEWTAMGIYCGLLKGRRVCPVPAPPALPKRGDA
jgi:hypothetical protein